MKVNVEIIKLANANDLSLPKYATDNSAGMDLMAAIDKDVIIKPLQRIMLPTGIKIALPDNFEAQIRPRSGLALKHGLTVLNTPGTIDADYRGEIAVILINLSNEDFIITRGMRIAQIIISQVAQANLIEVTELSETVRGTGGFGSTGIKDQ